MRDYKEAIKFLRENMTTKELGFNPNGMCLKVTREARGIGPVYPTAKAAQDATPRSNRVYRVRDLRRGMVLYYDDPNDSNRAGHVVTMIGRVRGFDKDALEDILVVSNSVKWGELAVVRGDYFPRYWGDPFVFGATWLNGHEIDHAGQKPKKSRVEKFNDGGPVWNLKLLDRAADNGRFKVGLIRNLIDHQVARLPKNDSLVNVRRFLDHYQDDRELHMNHLDKAVDNGRTGLVKKVRNEIKRLLDLLPES